MFCPECGYEYIDGVFKCNDCDVWLVSRPPDLESPNHVEMDESANSPMVEFRHYPGLGYGALVQAFLEENGVPALLLNSGAFVPAERLMVPEDKLQEAEKLLMEFDDAYHENQPDENGLDDTEEYEDQGLNLN